MKRTSALTLAAGLLALAAACSSGENPAPQPEAAAPAAAAPSNNAPTSSPIPLQSSRVRGYRGSLPPIPSSPYAAATPEVVRAVYEFAAARPDVLRYVPCFCGCERNGHNGNEDCFVSSRDAEGRPTWDPHGLT